MASCTVSPFYLLCVIPAPASGQEYDTSSCWQSVLNFETGAVLCEMCIFMICSLPMELFYHWCTFASLSYSSFCRQPAVERLRDGIQRPYSIPHPEEHGGLVAEKQCLLPGQPWHPVPGPVYAQTGKVNKKTDCLPVTTLLFFQLHWKSE